MTPGARSLNPTLPAPTLTRVQVRLISLRTLLILIDCSARRETSSSQDYPQSILTERFEALNPVESNHQPKSHSFIQVQNHKDKFISIYVLAGDRISKKENLEIKVEILKRQRPLENLKIQKYNSKKPQTPTKYPKTKIIQREEEQTGRVNLSRLNNLSQASIISSRIKLQQVQSGPTKIQSTKIHNLTEDPRCSPKTQHKYIMIDKKPPNINKA